MITIPLPDKWVRKAVFEAVQAVDPTLPIFDSRVTAELPPSYILMGPQNNISDPASKCGDRWLHTLQIDCYSQIPAVGNPGTRVAGDDLAEVVRGALTALSLDPASGLNLLRWSLSAPFDTVADLQDVMVTQKVLRLSCVIN